MNNCKKNEYVSLCKCAIDGLINLNSKNFKLLSVTFSYTSYFNIIIYGNYIKPDGINQIIDMKIDVGDIDNPYQDYETLIKDFSNNFICCKGDCIDTSYILFDVNMLSNIVDNNYANLLRAVSHNRIAWKAYTTESKINFMAIPVKLVLDNLDKLNISEEKKAELALNA